MLGRCAGLGTQPLFCSVVLLSEDSNGIIDSTEIRVRAVPMFE